MLDIFINHARIVLFTFAINGMTKKVVKGKNVI